MVKVVYKDFKFDSAHNLESPLLTVAAEESAFGACSKVHGHTYKLRVGITGGVKENTGMIMNFVELKELVNDYVIDKVDHNYLNIVPMFKDIIVTAENMVDVFWEQLYQPLFDAGVELHELCLWETETSFVRRTL